MIKTRKNKLNKDYWIYGKHTVLAALANFRRKIYELLITQETYNEIKSTIPCKIAAKIVERYEIDKILGGNQVHQGVILKTNPLEQPNLKDFLNLSKNEISTIVIIDKINDPQNLGAILRSSAAFDADAVIITKENSVRETAVSAKASCGAIENIPLISVTNISDAIKLLKKHEFWIIGMDATGDKGFAKVNSFKKTGIIFGSEGEGLRKLTKENCDFLISIPISNKVESLNLSNAVAISLFELNKKELY
ncbi:23S rRNA (guanosine(2251)-2'-O)-methyltransferase RlmB [Candidatus Jidaibacter acanthamoebae]|nr:23S rRNA (guanosine(2251)-2'-O)-methyltransferase RlmB [Candidatus Jidaibacter acanthamoeba]